MSQFPYRFFEEYAVRTPLFSHKIFRENFNKTDISEIDLRNICLDKTFQEAIYLASPYLYHEINSWLQSEKKLSSSQYQKLKNTILKYYTRMSTRCTPFGLFSGVGLGKFNNQTENDNLSDNIQLKVRDTKLDMHLLVSLSKTLEKNPDIRSQLLYFPNNSIYKIGKRIRYVEYEYKEGKRDYIISSAPLSEELSQILDFSKRGKTISQIAKIIVGKDVNQQEAKEFIEELIDNQVLVSELEPNVSGFDYLDIIISVLNKIEAKNEIKILTSVKKKLNQLDLYIGNSVSLYEEIEDMIKSFKTDYEQKYLFQTDLYCKDEFNISNHWKKEVKKGLSFLNRITLLSKDTSFENFKKAFYERFETQEMPLSYVLDTEIGIGYLQNKSVKGVHPYLDDLKLNNSQKKQDDLHIKLTPFQRILNGKLQEALLENQFKISLNDDDIKDFEEKWYDLPDTLSVMVEIISENNQEQLCIGSAGGSSAANLLGRFCSEKSEVQNLTKTITQKEEELNLDYILAEIIHLPEARIGNVIRRPTLRKYEIPYLAQSVLSKENQILVDDLYISLKNDRIVLRSKKFNKEIKPYLTNAHNYYTNTLPVYHFLSDLNSQNIRTGLYFDWGGLNHIYPFLPRVEYKCIILSKAQWKITEKDITSLESVMNDKNELLSQTKIWRNKRQIPQWIQWMKSDNTLPMNLENYDMTKLFIHTIISEKSIIIEEFLYNENDDFKREFIFPIYK